MAHDISILRLNPANLRQIYVCYYVLRADSRLRSPTSDAPKGPALSGQVWTGAAMTLTGLPVCQARMASTVSR